MKFDRQLRPATETSWVVSYGGKTIPRERTASILKIDISPHFREQSSDFHEILYTATYFELDERQVIEIEKVALDRLRDRQNVFSCILSVLATRYSQRIWTDFDVKYAKTRGSRRDMPFRGREHKIQYLDFIFSKLTPFWEPFVTDLWQFSSNDRSEKNAS